MSGDKYNKSIPPASELDKHPEQAPVESADQGMQAVVGTLRYLFVGLRILLVFLLFTFFFGAILGIENFGGFFFVDEHEEAMLFRFGRLRPVTVDGETREVFGSGTLLWRWPYPVDQVKRISTQRPVVIESRHFWPQVAASQLDPMSGQGADIEQGLRPGYDGYLLTGDTNIMHMTWMLNYRVIDPKQHYLKFNDARVGEQPAGQLTDRRLSGTDMMVRNLLEQAVLREVATWSGEEVWRLTRLPGRGAAAAPTTGTPSEQPDIADMIEMEMNELELAETVARDTGEHLVQAVRERVVRLIADTGLGIEVQDVRLFDVQPPRPTLPSFIAVSEAAQEYRQSIDMARTYENRITAEARSQAASLIADGEAYMARLVARAEADAEVFQQINKQYAENPESVLVALYSDTLRAVLATVDEKYVLPAVRDGASQEVRLLLGPEAVRIGK